MTVLDLPINSSVTIRRIEANKKIGSNLRQMGVVPGTRIRVIRKAPLGGPVLMVVDGREIAVSEQIAAMIEVESCESP